MSALSPAFSSCMIYTLFVEVPRCLEIPLSSISSLFTAHCYANEVSRHTNPSNFGMMKVNSGHHSGHPNRNIRYYDSEGNDDDIGEGGEPILGELSYPNKSSAVLRVKSVECSA